MSDINATDVNALHQRLEGPAPVMDVAKDLVRRVVLIGPVLIGVGAIFYQTNGAASVAFGLAIVIVNFLMAAYLLAWAGRISFAAMGGAAMFGFLIRLGLIFVAVLLVQDASWIEFVPFGITLIVAHLGILFGRCAISRAPWPTLVLSQQRSCLLSTLRQNRLLITKPQEQPDVFVRHRGSRRG